jgi:hypothetical protein
MSLNDICNFLEFSRRKILILKFTTLKKNYISIEEY